MPGARGDEVARDDDRLIDIGRAAALGVELALGDRRDGSAAQHPRGGEDLDAVADARDGQVAREERPHDAHEIRIVAEVFGRAPAGEDEPLILVGADVLERDVGREVVAGRFAGDVPALGALVQDEVIEPLRRGRDENLVAVFADAIQGVERVQNLGGVADDEQHTAHAWSLRKSIVRMRTRVV